MNRTKKLIFSFFISMAIMNSKCVLSNHVYAAGNTPNIQSSAYSSDLNIFTKYGYKGQCTWFTYGRALEKLGISLPSEFYGNAVDWWYADVKDNVYSYGSEPKANSIAVWGGGRYGYGHVGFVEEVEGNTVYLNEGNFKVSHNYDGAVKLMSKEEMKDRGNLYLKGYIYLNEPSSSKNAQSTSANSGQASSNSEAVIKQGVVNLSNSSSALNVRNSSSTSSTILGYLKSGQKVSIVGSYGDWYKIKFNSSYAYVSAKYIKTTDTASTSQPNSSASKTVVSASITSISTKSGVVKLKDASSFLNLRNNPSGSILSTLSNGTKVNILGSNGNWYKISAGEKTGYVLSDYISVSSNDSTSSQTASTVSDKIGTVNLSSQSSTLNLRNNPWTGTIISTLAYGSKVKIIGNSGRWYKVQVGSTIGYVHSDYIKL